MVVVLVSKLNTVGYCTQVDLICKTENKSAGIFPREQPAPFDILEFFDEFDVLLHDLLVFIIRF